VANVLVAPVPERRNQRKRPARRNRTDIVNSERVSQTKVKTMFSFPIWMATLSSFFDHIFQFRSEQMFVVPGALRMTWMC
jgi:hypothetical protein